VSKIDQFDIDQLLLNLHGELSQVMAGAAVGKDGTRLQIQRLDFRMGQRLENEQENSLDAERYPSKEDWQVELTYEPGKAVLLGADEKASINRSDLLIKRLSDQPLNVIKGLSTYWSEQWGEFGVSSLGALASFKMQNLLEKIPSTPSQMVNHYSLVQQLQFEFPPLLNEHLYQKSLALFWEGAIVQLKKELSPLSEQQIQTFQHLAWRMATILDLSFVQSLNMEIWAPA